MKKSAQIKNPLAGRRLYIPRMGTEGASIMAAAFRSVGIDAYVSPESDEETLPLAARFTTGEECLPQRITLGNHLKVILKEGYEPQKNAFLMPTSSGPCRFGQYAPFMKKILRELHMEDTIVFSPTSSNGYAGFGSHAKKLKRKVWRTVVTSDLLRKLLLIYRPYEKNKGETEAIIRSGVDEICQILKQSDVGPIRESIRIVKCLKKTKKRLEKIQLQFPLASKPLIGVVGEIFLRFNEFSNQYMVKKIEKLGGEAWMADVSEWVWYTNDEEILRIRDNKETWSRKNIMTRLRHTMQKLDESIMHHPFKRLFHHRREATVQEVLMYAQSYLPQKKAMGEMTLNTGKAISFYKEGCDGVVDISPFSCMNGIVTEAVYPTISKDLNHFPIRIFYFDGVPFDLERDLEIFMEQVKAYREKRFQNQDQS